MIKIEELHFGDKIYSKYTNADYIISSLPRINNNNNSCALIRTDGSGYCYLSRSLQELQNKIYNSGEECYKFKVEENVVYFEIIDGI